MTVLWILLRTKCLNRIRGNPNNLGRTVFPQTWICVSQFLGRGRLYSSSGWDDKWHLRCAWLDSGLGNMWECQEHQCRNCWYTLRLNTDAALPWGNPGPTVSSIWSDDGISSWYLTAVPVLLARKWRTVQPRPSLAPIKLVMLMDVARQWWTCQSWCSLAVLGCAH